MPDMKTTILHMRCQSVRVNGTNYDIDEYGIARDVSIQDAKRLLMNSAGTWNETYAPPRVPITAPEPEPTEEAKVPDEPLNPTGVLDAPDEIPMETPLEAPIEAPVKKLKKAKRKTRKAAKAKKKE